MKQMVCWFLGWFGLSAAGVMATDLGKEAWADSMIRPYVDSGNFMGVVLVARGDQIVFEKAYGMADLEKQRPNLIQTPFQIASVSKSFTAVALLWLVDSGQVELHAPLSRYLPDYPGGDQITIIQLLTHRSGIPNLNTLEEYETLEKSAQTPASLIPVFSHLPLQFKPGQDRRYSNSNFVLLARIIEKQSGLAYGDFLEKHIFGPLAMRRSGHPKPTGSIQKDGAIGYRGEGAAGLVRARTFNWTVKTGNGSLYSTAGDLFRWARGVRFGKILSATALDAMFKDHGYHDGLGWFIRERLGRKAIYINGRSPGYSSYLGIFPNDDLIVVVLANTYVPIATELGLDLAAKALGEPRPPSRLQSQPLSFSEVAPFVGAYQFDAQFYSPNQVLTIDFENGYLKSNWGTMIARDVRNGHFIQRRYWSEMKFIRDDSGKITAMMFDEFKGQRLPDPE